MTLTSIAALLALTGLAGAQAPFALRSGDTVVFYGDSITDARYYTTYAEAYVRTRYPGLDVRFVHSGWSSDRVSGGPGGTIDVRLERDVFLYRPTVVTIMLGMNDGGVRPFDPVVTSTFMTGYKSIVDRLKTRLPGVRLTLIQPSPYDDVTRPPAFPGGYNGVLQLFSENIRELAVREGATTADFNAPVVVALQRVLEKNRVDALRLLPDRVHPGPAMHLVMAESLLRSWNATSVVSTTELDAGRERPIIDSGQVSNLQRLPSGGYAWRSTEGALPFPLDVADPLVALVLANTNVVGSLNQQIVRFKGLPADRPYVLSIDGGTTIASGTGAQWERGVNLGGLATPMMAQARDVLTLVRTRSDVHQARWRTLQVPLSGRSEGAKERERAMKALDDYDRSLAEGARKAAKPREHRFVLSPQ